MILGVTWRTTICEAGSVGRSLEVILKAVEIVSRIECVPLGQDLLSSDGWVRQPLADPLSMDRHVKHIKGSAQVSV